MLFTSAAIIRMAKEQPPVIERLLNLSHDRIQDVIKKARSLQTGAIVDKEQDDQLDQFIGICSMIEAKKRLGDAMALTL